MKKMIGIVDALGVESFMPLEGNEDRISYLKMRASFNGQRNAQTYLVELTEEEISRINNLIVEKTEVGFIKAGKIITEKIDRRFHTNYTEINKELLKLYNIRGYL